MSKVVVYTDHPAGECISRLQYFAEKFTRQTNPEFYDPHGDSIFLVETDGVDFEVTVFGGQARGSENPICVFHGTVARDGRTGKTRVEGSFVMGLHLKLAAGLLSLLTLLMVGGSLYLMARGPQPQDARIMLGISAAGCGGFWLLLLGLVCYGRRRIRGFLKSVLGGG